MANDKTYDRSDLSEFAIEFTGAMRVKGVAEANYRADDGYNQSFLKDVLSVSPSYAYHIKDNPEETPALLFGTALHAYILENGKFNAKYAVMLECDRRTKEGKAYYENFCVENAGKTVLKHEDYHKILDMNIKAKPYFMFDDERIVDNEAQFYASAVVVGGKFKGQKLKFKGLLDQISVGQDDVIVKDLKSVQDISNVSGASYNNGWAVQAALYHDMVDFALRKPVKFKYIAVGKDKPYDCRQFIVSDEMLIKGRKQYTEAVHRLLSWEAAGRPSTAEFLGEETLNG